MIVITFFCSCFPGASGLRHVAVTVPLAVAPGDTVTLGCSYDLEGEPLYTVKWYKGSKEFFRYVPKELPHTRVFPLHGINVDVSKEDLMVFAKAFRIKECNCLQTYICLYSPLVFYMKKNSLYILMLNCQKWPNILWMIQNQ